MQVAEEEGLIDEEVNIKQEIDVDDKDGGSCWSNTVQAVSNPSFPQCTVSIQKIPWIDNLQKDVYRVSKSSSNNGCDSDGDSSSSACLDGDDLIEVYCRKCSSDFASLQSFLTHLRKKFHNLPPKENYPPSPPKRPKSKANNAVIRKKYKKREKFTTTTSSSSSNAKSLLLENPPLDGKEEKAGTKLDIPSSSSQDFVPTNQSDLELDSDPQFDPLDVVLPVPMQAKPILDKEEKAAKSLEAKQRYHRNAVLTAQRQRKKKAKKLLVEPPTEYKCHRKRCYEVFPDLPSLKRHLKDHKRNVIRPVANRKKSIGTVAPHRKKFRCKQDKCHRLFTKKKGTEYFAHIESHKKGDGFVCSVNPNFCAKLFATQDEVEGHQLKCATIKYKYMEIPSPSSSSASSPCPSPVPEEPEAEEPEQEPEDENSDSDRDSTCNMFRCTYSDCEEDFPTLSDFYKHKTKVHTWYLKYQQDENPAENETEPPPLLPCPYKGCTEFLKSKLCITRHVQRVHEKIGKNFLCTSCGSAFYTAERLKLHERTHSDVRPFKCDAENCTSTFKTKPTLMKHRMIHLQEKTYLCMFCGRAFRTSDAMNVHLRLHSDEKRFKCSICPDVGYNHKVTLKSHMQKVHPEFEGQL